MRFIMFCFKFDCSIFLVSFTACFEYFIVYITSQCPNAVFKWLFASFDDGFSSFPEQSTDKAFPELQLL